MKNNIYLLSKLLFVLLLVFLLPFSVFAQSLPPIPDVGEGVCVSNCGGSTSMGSQPTMTSEPVTISIITNSLQTIISLENQALKKIKEKEYAEAELFINNSIESLNDAKTILYTDPELKQFRDEKPEIISKLNKSIDKSLKSLEKASSLIVRVNNPATEEGFLSKLIKDVKKALLDGRRSVRHTHSIAVAGVRG